MMNILMLTAYYPNLQRPNAETKADHYFAREWTAAGHRVLVLHNMVGFFFKKNDYQKSLKEPARHENEGVTVYDVNVNRYVPKSNGLFPWDAKRAAAQDLKCVGLEGMTPDIIFVDFCGLQWEVARRVAERFTCPVIPIFNNCDIADRKVVSRITAAYRRVGVRSRKIQEAVERHAAGPVFPFLISSGAPDQLLSGGPPNRSGGEAPAAWRLIYVGSLIPLKKVGVTLSALAQLRDRYDFTFDIVGDGECRPELEARVHVNGLGGRVVFHGRKSRGEVLDLLRRSDCFVMVSSPETFGIVYLEALACGCYVIGSRGEGIDGILVDGENGGLATPGDADALREALERYFQMSTADRARILGNGFKTAGENSESAVARRFLEDALK